MQLSNDILDYRKKQTKTLRISENIILTNNDVTNYVTGALQWKLPRAPLSFNPALLSGETVPGPEWSWNNGQGGSSRRAAGLQPSLKNVRQKIPPNGQTRVKIPQHNHFRYFRHHFGSTFPMNPTKPMFRCLPTTPLMRWRFQHTCRWIWRFRGCHPHSPKGKKANNWLQKTWWYIRL